MKSARGPVLLHVWVHSDLDRNGSSNDGSLAVLFLWSYNVIHDFCSAFVSSLINYGLGNHCRCIVQLRSPVDMDIFRIV